MSDTTVYVAVRPGPDSDPETTDRMTRRLRAELAELDVDSATLAGAAAPADSKGVDAGSAAGIVVALASGGAFTAILQTARDWLGRQPGGHRLSVTIDGDTIELDGATGAQQRALIDAFVQRHAD